MSSTPAGATGLAEPPDEAPPGDDSRTGSGRRRLSPELRRAALAGLVFTFVWAAGCNALLDVAQGTNGIDSGFGILLREKPLVFLVSAVLLWVVLGLLVAVTGRGMASAAILLLLVAPVALANYEKLTLRSEPVYPADLTFLAQPTFLTDMVGLRPLVAMVVAVVVVGAAYAWVTRRVRRRYDPALWRRGSAGWRPWLVARVVMLVVAVLVLTLVRGFNGAHNPVRKAYEIAGAEWTPWSQRDNYQRHGVVAGLLYNLDVTPMERPPGYSAARMQQVADRYRALADRMNKGRSPAALRNTNVVVVLSEAFSDPTRMPGVQLAEDPIPFTRRLLGQTPSGTMLSQLIGGGTANIEFEALTGQSISQFTPQLTTPYQMLVPREKDYPSAVGYFASQGDHTLSVHPFHAHMYQRDAVYPVFGMDDEVFDDQMHYRHLIDDNNFISDSSAFDEVLSHLRDASAPTFVQLVTMQNHYPYAGKYHDPIPVTGVTGGAADQLSNYARGLRYSDDALRQFLASLKKMHRPTAVVFYGDHTPALWADSSEVDKLGEHARVFHETPYFLWSSDGRLQGRTAAPVSSPIYFLPMLLDELGAPLPPYYALLLKLQRRLPAMLPGSYLTPSGQLVGVDALDARTRRLLEDYRLVQYDMSVGHRYAQSEMFYPRSSGGAG